MDANPRNWAYPDGKSYDNRNKQGKNNEPTTLATRKTRSRGLGAVLGIAYSPLRGINLSLNYLGWNPIIKQTI